MKTLLATGCAAAVLLFPMMAAMATDLVPETGMTAPTTVGAGSDPRRIVVSGPADIVITVKQESRSKPTVRWYPDNRYIVVPDEATGTVQPRPWLDLDDFGGAPAPDWHEEDLPPARSTIHITIETVDR